MADQISFPVPDSIFKPIKGLCLPGETFEVIYSKLSSTLCPGSSSNLWSKQNNTSVVSLKDVNYIDKYFPHLSGIKSCDVDSKKRLQKTKTRCKRKKKILTRSKGRNQTGVLKPRIGTKIETRHSNEICEQPEIPITPSNSILSIENTLGPKDESVITNNKSVVLNEKPAVPIGESTSTVEDSILPTEKLNVIKNNTDDRDGSDIEKSTANNADSGPRSKDMKGMSKSKKIIPKKSKIINQTGPVKCKVNKNGALYHSATFCEQLQNPISLENPIVPIEKPIVAIEESNLPVEKSVLPIEKSVVPIEKPVVPIDELILSIEKSMSIIEDPILLPDKSTLDVSNTANRECSVIDTYFPHLSEIKIYDNSGSGSKKTKSISNPNKIIPQNTFKNLISVEKSIVPIDGLILPIEESTSIYDDSILLPDKSTVDVSNTDNRECSVIDTYLPHLSEIKIYDNSGLGSKKTKSISNPNKIIPQNMTKTPISLEKSLVPIEESVAPIKMPADLSEDTIINENNLGTMENNFSKICEGTKIDDCVQRLLEEEELNKINHGPHTFNRIAPRNRGPKRRKRVLSEVGTTSTSQDLHINLNDINDKLSALDKVSEEPDCNLNSLNIADANKKMFPKKQVITSVNPSQGDIDRSSCPSLQVSGGKSQCDNSVRGVNKNTCCNSEETLQRTHEISVQLQAQQLLNDLESTQCDISFMQVKCNEQTECLSKLPVGKQYNLYEKSKERFLSDAASEMPPVFPFSCISPVLINVNNIYINIPEISKENPDPVHLAEQSQECRPPNNLYNKFSCNSLEQPKQTVISCISLENAINVPLSGCLLQRSQGKQPSSMGTLSHLPKESLLSSDLSVQSKHGDSSVEQPKQKVSCVSLDNLINTPLPGCLLQQSKEKQPSSMETLSSLPKESLLANDLSIQSKNENSLVEQIKQKVTSDISVELLNNIPLSGYLLQQSKGTQFSSMETLPSLPKESLLANDLSIQSKNENSLVEQIKQKVTSDISVELLSNIPLSGCLLQQSKGKQPSSMENLSHQPKEGPLYNYSSTQSKHGNSSVEQIKKKSRPRNSLKQIIKSSPDNLFERSRGVQPLLDDSSRQSNQHQRHEEGISPYPELNLQLEQSPQRKDTITECNIRNDVETVLEASHFNKEVIKGLECLYASGLQLSKGKLTNAKKLLGEAKINLVGLADSPEEDFFGIQYPEELTNVTKLLSKAEKNLLRLPASPEEDYFVIQCPEEIDPRSFVGKEINLSGFSSISLNNCGTSATYEVSVNDKTEKPLSILLPNKDLSALQLGSLPLAGTLTLSHREDNPVPSTSYMTHQETTEEPELIVADNSDKLPESSYPCINIKKEETEEEPEYISPEIELCELISSFESKHFYKREENVFQADTGDYNLFTSEQTPGLKNERLEEPEYMVPDVEFSELISSYETT